MVPGPFILYPLPVDDPMTRGTHEKSY